jgi:Zn-dependent peptidase ImmA (M78 family)
MVLQHESGEIMDNVYVRLDDLPDGVRGFVSLDEDGDYNVYINKDLSYDQQMSTLAHEIIHIDNDHLRVQLPAILCESA